MTISVVSRAMLHGLSSRQWWWVTLFVTMRLALTMGLSPSNLKYSAKWKREHEKNVNNARAAVKRGGKLDVLWLGDSITRRLVARSPHVYKVEFGHLDTLLEGIDGDETGHLLFRMANGEVPKELSPTVTVLHIGTNDLARVVWLELVKANNTAKDELVRQTSQGCIRVLQDLAARLPRTKFLVMPILPRGVDRGLARRSEKHIPTLGGVNWTLPNLFTPVIDETNRQVQQYVRTSKELASRTSIVDCGFRLVSEDGKLSREFLPDALHPSSKGYEVLIDCLWPELGRLGGFERPAVTSTRQKQGSGERHIRTSG